MKIQAIREDNILAIDGEWRIVGAWSAALPEGWWAVQHDDAGMSDLEFGPSNRRNESPVPAGVLTLLRTQWENAGG